MAKTTSEKPAGRWLRVLRPICWWVLLVLVLYGVRTHQRLMENTRLNFSVSMQGQAIDASAVLDGKPAESGQNISLGHHTFAVTNPEGEPLTTNLFIWYGRHDLGTIDLKRTMGTLAVSADPPAPLLSVRGPEWSLVLTNSAGFTNSVPTDQYAVESQYAHWGRADDVVVMAGLTAAWQIAPKLGAVQLACNEDDASFQLLTMDDRQLESVHSHGSVTDSRYDGQDEGANSNRSFKSDGENSGGDWEIGGNPAEIASSTSLVGKTFFHSHPTENRKKVLA